MRARTLSVRLRKPLERSLRAGHPWIFREALEAFEAAPGTPVRVLDRKGGFVASGLCDAGPIAVRAFTLQDRAVDAALFAERIDLALALRGRIQPPDTDAYRLLHGEGDRLPGVVCDRYGSRAVLKLDGEAALALSATWSKLLQERLPTLGIETLLVRSSRKQGESVSIAWGPRPPEEISVLERGMTLVVNLYDGQKTGLFLDHRESRARIRALSDQLSVLNLYGYTGGFSIAAGLGGASYVTTVDQAKPALALADRSWQANGLAPELHHSSAGDAVEYLTTAADRGERHGLIIADPPNFAPRQNTLDQALKAYEALHLAVLRLLPPGGLYLAASCSSHVDRQAFEQTLSDAARRARRVLQVLERSSAPADHPRLLAFPEGDYLKITLLRAD